MYNFPTMVNERTYAGLVGRFQPWHRGHQQILARMVATGHRPVLFLGSCNADRDLAANPFSFEERAAIIRKACEGLSYPDGGKVEPVLVPVYDYPRRAHEKPFEKDGEKHVPLNARWFAQFVEFFIRNDIRPEDFTLYYAAKDMDKKNYVFQPRYEAESLTLRDATPEMVARNEDLSKVFELMGVKRVKVDVSDENATAIRADFAGGRDLLLPGCHELIETILRQERERNAIYDLKDISDQSFAADPFQVLRHERRALHAHLHKAPDDPGFHKRVLVVGGDGSLGVPVIEKLLELGHDLVLASPRPDALKESLADTLVRFPDAKVTHVAIDLREPATGEAFYWEEIYRYHAIDAVMNMAGIIEEKPQAGLTFENINYRPVPAMAAACVARGIDRYVYFSTITARSREAGDNAQQSAQPLTYAGSKRKAELALKDCEDKLNTFIVRPVTTYNPATGNWGRDMTLPDLANLPVVPVWGSGEQVMQPLHIDDLAKVARLVESNRKGFQACDAVGDQRIKLKDIMKVLRRMKDGCPTAHIPYDRALRLADHYPLGGINRSFISVMEKLETPVEKVDPGPWTRAIGEEKGLTSLRDAYNSAVSGTNVKFGAPPVKKYAVMISRHPDEFFSLLRDSGGSDALIEEVRNAMDGLRKGAKPVHDDTLLKRVIETLGRPRP